MTVDFFDYQGNQDHPTLKSRGLFSRFHDGDWEKVGEFGAVRHYTDGAKIYTSENTTQALFFLSAGVVELVMDKPAAFNSSRVELKQGSAFGLLSFFDGQARGAQAFARGSVETLMLDRAMFERLSAWHPRVAMIILQDLAEVIARKLRQRDALL